MINAIAEFFSLNLVWIFGLAIYNLPDNTPDWIGLIFVMFLLICLIISFFLMTEDID